MIIREHLLESEGIKFKKSPNHSGMFDIGLPDTIIIHYTAGSSAASSIRTLCDSNSKASTHALVGRDGSITQLVPFNTIAWHAGKSSYQGRVGLNKFAIGIEIDNAGRLTKSGAGYAAWFGRVYPDKDVMEAVHQNESAPAYWHTYTEKQIDAVFDICVNLMNTYNISMILGHEEIARGRKSDPGPAFPLEKLRERVLLRERADEGAIEAVSKQHTGLVTAHKLNIRSSPMRSAATVAPPLSRGTMLDILQESRGWYEVEVHTRGWVKKDYIKT